MLLAELETDSCVFVQVNYVMRLFVYFLLLLDHMQD